MKDFIIYGIVALAVISLSACARNFISGRKKSVDLPEACALPSMTPMERQAHQARLELLGRAATLRETSKEGFVFEVDLRRMPETELRLWAEKEQRCCSFITLDARVTQPEVRAEVHVRVPPHLRDAMMTTFGLR